VHAHDRVSVLVDSIEQRRLDALAQRVRQDDVQLLDGAERRTTTSTAREKLSSSRSQSRNFCFAVIDARRFFLRTAA
jgi:hypothetical protein